MPSDLLGLDKKSLMSVSAFAGLGTLSGEPSDRYETTESSSIEVTDLAKETCERSSQSGSPGRSSVPSAL